MAEEIANVGGISVTEENYLRLRKQYRIAVKKEKQEFRCFKHLWATAFVKYVLELMETNPIIKPLIDTPDK